ncbi:NSUN2 [Symbiodinium sp. CCMP2456]|nr:NSUN2 [Symbiodinium sp. CCMP2456]
MAVLVPQKPSTPPPASKSPRRRMSATLPASPLQSSTGSEPGAADLAELQESVTSPSVSPSISMISSASSDFQECRVHFEETPEIILFLTADEGSAHLTAVAEEDARGEADEIGETPWAVPAGHDSCEGGGGLAELAAERREAMLRKFRKLFPDTARVNA